MGEGSGGVVQWYIATGSIPSINNNNECILKGKRLSGKSEPADGSFSSPTHGCFSRGRAGSTRSAGWGLLGGGLRSSLTEPEVLSQSGLSNCTGRGGLEKKGLSPVQLKGAGQSQANELSLGRQCQFGTTYQG